MLQKLMRRLRLSGGVVLVSGILVASVVAAGCGGPSAVSPSTSIAPDSSAIGGSSPGASTSPGGSAGPAVDGTARLTAAFKKMATGYQFDATVTIAGQTATHAAGRWLGGRSEFVVESGGTALTYRSIPPRSWVFQEGSGWTELADKAPSGDPLEPFRHPIAVTVASEDASALVLAATYPPKTLGVGGTAPVAVQISVSADGRATATYTVDSTGGPVTTTTILIAGKGAPIPEPKPSG
jgi:hypothetical protein